MRPGAQNSEKVTLSQELTGMKGRPLQTSAGTRQAPGQPCVVCSLDSSGLPLRRGQRPGEEWARNAGGRGRLSRTGCFHLHGRGWGGPRAEETRMVEKQGGAGATEKA